MILNPDTSAPITLEETGVQVIQNLLKFLRYPGDHLERSLALVMILVFFIRVDLGEVAGFQGLLLHLLKEKVLS